MHLFNKREFRLAGVLALLVFFWGCSDNGTGPDNGDNGGGGGGSASSVTANAGSDMEAVVGFDVTADGSGSAADGDITYDWQLIGQPSGSDASLSSASTVNPQFTPDLPGPYALLLEASSGDSTDTDTLKVSAIAKRLFIDAQHGTDADTSGYMADTPLQTLTQALARYAMNEDSTYLDIDTMRVARGTYDEANGESFPMDFSGNLIVKGDPDVDRDNIHILSPDVDREPTVELGEGVTLRHLHIENGYTGGTFSGDPDAVFVKSGSSSESSSVILEDVTLRINAEEGVILSTGSTINVEVRSYDGARSLIDGKGIGQAYTNRFNTSNARLDVRDTDIRNIRDDAFSLDDANNVNLFITNSTVRPSSNANAAFLINADNCGLTLDGVTVTSSDSTAAGSRFSYAIDMDADQPNTSINVMNSTLQYASRSTINLFAVIARVTDSIIEGTNTEERSGSGGTVDLSSDGIRHLDGSLRVRGTTFRDIFGNAIGIGGPVSPNDNDFSVDLGTENAPGNNSFEQIDGWDVDLTRGDNDITGEVPAIGNSWSNGTDPRCWQDRSEPENGEIQVSTDGNSVRWGTQSGQVCS